MNTTYFSIGNALYCDEYYEPYKKKEVGTRRNPTSNPTKTNASYRGAKHLDWCMWSARLLTNPYLN